MNNQVVISNRRFHCPITGCEVSLRIVIHSSMVMGENHLVTHSLSVILEYVWISQDIK